MALIECHECKKQISSEAANCPGCGAKVKIPKPAKKSVSGKSILKWVGISFCLIFLMQAVGAYKQSQKTPDELKQDAAAKQANIAKKAENDKNFEIRFNREKTAAIAAVTVKNASRNPDSVSWTSFMTNDDASVVCMELRAENGFGGMTVEDVSVFNGKISTEDGPWNKHCVNKKLFDVTDGTLAILKRL